MIVITSVLMVSLVIGSIVTYWHSAYKIEVEMAAAVSVVESAVAESLAHIPDAKDPRTDLSRIVAAFDGDRHVRIKWLDNEGQVIQQSRIGLPASPAPDWLHSLLSDPRPTRTFDVAQNGQSLGRILIAPDTANEISEVWENIQLKFAIIGGFCTITFVMIYLTLSRALRPLDNLSAALVRVGEGDYEAHVIEAGPEELANIYKKFNGMAAKLAEAERQNRRLNEQLLTVQEEERTEIARDLHDEIGPFLFAVDVDAQTIPPLLARGAGDDVAICAAAIRQSVGHMQTHLRSVLNRLRPAMMLDLGLAHAADHLAAFWRARRPNIEFDVDIEQESFGSSLDQVAFRVLQEGTSNAVRHGDPSRVKISTRRTGNGWLKVSVIDDGQGLTGKGQRGFGIPGMRERVAMIGGRLSIENNRGKPGVALVAELPTEREARLPQAADELKVTAA
jgi:two-component system sensor histidine kinase UhpB